jgi:hypothetical protein
MDQLMFIGRESMALRSQKAPPAANVLMAEKVWRDRLLQALRARGPRRLRVVVRRKRR